MGSTDLTSLPEKILIANRGEIAVRILRACRELGIRSVAVYSEADATALHVRMADEAVFLGPAQAAHSYLSIKKLIEAALHTGAQAIHPGYGFLSENAVFAHAVNQAGLTFIGPSAHSIQAMGDKAEARARMQAAGVPVVPGYQGPDDDTALARAAEQIGYPVVVKAAGGGGGKGMRVVEQAVELSEALAAARREAQHAFGSTRLILEHYIRHAHHIEFQVLADTHGNCLHLFERECSVQRRHQKIIEESPSPLIDDALRVQMGAAAVQAAKAVNYHNAGTVEFIVDPSTRQFYFLEMNTRLQVEHPVTELVTGIDLVQWQIRIAAGERLGFTQREVSQRGHAIECRLYAEDPANAFLPAAGKLLRFMEPKGPGVRVDSGFTSGDEITLNYDPLLAKVIVHAEERQAAIRKMANTLHELVVLGLPTNWQFLQDVLGTTDFNAGRIHTTWIEDHFRDWQPPHCALAPEVLIAGALTQFQTTPGAPAASHNTVGERDPFSPWLAANGFRLSE